MSRIKIERTSVNFKLPQVEIEVLEKYATQESLTKTEVIRGLIRSLKKKIVENEEKDV